MYLCFGVTARDRRVGPFQKIFLQVDIYVQSNNKLEQVGITMMNFQFC